MDTLWSAARAKGLKTAAVGWPQTEGGPIDYRINISTGRTAAESHERTLRSASPGGWVAEIEQRLGPLAGLDLRMVDHLKALVAVEILATGRPC